MNKKNELAKIKIRYGRIFILPWIVGVILFFLIPLFKSILYSFTNVKLSNINNLDFCGLKHYNGSESTLLKKGFCPQTNTLYLDIDLPVSGNVTIILESDCISRENYDISELCKDILIRSKLAADEKYRILNNVKRTDISDPHEKLSQLFSSYNEEFHLLGAVRELLTLKQDEFALSQRYLFN